MPKALVALTALIWLAPTFADNEPAPRFRIAIEVTVADEGLSDRVSMYLRNELQGLGDVAVTSENPDYKLYAMVTEMRTSAGGRIAYILEPKRTADQ